MSRFAITGASLVLPTHVQPDGVVIVEDEKIVAAGARLATPIPRGTTRIDARGGVVIPGLVDMHINGFGGVDVFDAGRADLARMGAALAARGVTSYVPTLPTSPFPSLCRALAKLAGIVATPAPAGCAEPLGVYVEGPFLSDAKRGAHPSQDLRSPRADSVKQLMEVLGSKTRIVAIAPELPGAIDAIRTLHRAGALVALAHTNADTATCALAATAGARHVSHLFNAMGALHHRTPGLAGYTLGSNELTAEIIADGHHVDRFMVAMAWRAMGADRLALVSDAVAPAGTSLTDGQAVRLESGLGRVKIKRSGAPGAVPRAETANGTLAGSVASLSECLRFAVREAGIPLADAVRMASTTPARIAGAGRHKGRLETGFDADVVILDAQLQPKQVWVRGRAIEGGAPPVTGTRKAPRQRPYARRR